MAQRGSAHRELLLLYELEPTVRPSPRRSLRRDLGWRSADFEIRRQAETLEAHLHRLAGANPGNALHIQISHIPCRRRLQPSLPARLADARARFPDSPPRGYLFLHLSGAGISRGCQARPGAGRT